MEETKKEEPGESKEVKRPKIDSAIIEELMKGYEQPSDLTGPLPVVSFTVAQLKPLATSRDSTINPIPQLAS